jgi:hypothetical protein
VIPVHSFGKANIFRIISLFDAAATFRDSLSCGRYHIPNGVGCLNMITPKHMIIPKLIARWQDGALP